MRKLTKGRVCEDLIHEFVVSPVARQGKGPSRYMLELFGRVLFIKPLRWLQLPLCETKQIRTNAALLAPDATHGPGRDSCYHCGRAGYDARAPPFHDFVARASLVHPAVRLPPYPRLPPQLRSEACRQRDLREVRAALASRPSQRRLARYAGATGTVELAGLAEQAGRLVKSQR